MDNFLDKIPNWLRYILAIPFGIISVIFFSFIISLSTLLYSDVDSLWFKLCSFIYSNGINIIIFFYTFNYILPKYNFKITLAFTIIIGILYSILQGVSFAANTFTLEYIIAFILVIISLIISCVMTYNQFKEKNNTEDDVIKNI